MKFLDRLKNLRSDSKGRAEERKQRVASDLAIVIAKANLKRKDVASALNISEAALSIRLNGSQNLTLDSIGGICEVAGCDFDIVFRRADEAVASSFWESDDVMLAPFADIELWVGKTHPGVLQYEVPSFIDATPAANEQAVEIKKNEAKPLAA